MNSRFIELSLDFVPPIEQRRRGGADDIMKQP